MKKKEREAAIGEQEELMEQEEVAADELMRGLDGEQEEPAQEEEVQEPVQDFRAGIRQLIEDGWTREELTAMAEDEIVREELAEGVPLTRAATGFLRRMARGRIGRKRGVPTFRASAADNREQDRIASMSDEQFRAFSKRAMDAALSGKKVSLR